MYQMIMSNIQLLCHYPITAWRCTVNFPKKFSKITDCIETALFTDTGKTVIGIQQQMSSHREAVLCKIFCRRLTKQSAETTETISFVRITGEGNHIDGDRL